MDPPVNSTLSKCLVEQTAATYSSPEQKRQAKRMLSEGRPQSLPIGLRNRLQAAAAGVTRSNSAPDNFNGDIPIQHILGPQADILKLESEFVFTLADVQRLSADQWADLGVAAPIQQVLQQFAAGVSTPSLVSLDKGTTLSGLCTCAMGEQAAVQAWCGRMRDMGISHARNFKDFSREDLREIGFPMGIQNLIVEFFKMKRGSQLKTHDHHKPPKLGCLTRVNATRSIIFDSAKHNRFDMRWTQGVIPYYVEKSLRDVLVTSPPLPKDEPTDHSFDPKQVKKGDTAGFMEVLRDSLAEWTDPLKVAFEKDIIQFVDVSELIDRHAAAHKDKCKAPADPTAENPWLRFQWEAAKASNPSKSMTEAMKMLENFDEEIRQLREKKKLPSLDQITEEIPALEMELYQLKSKISRLNGEADDLDEAKDKEKLKALKKELKELEKQKAQKQTAVDVAEETLSEVRSFNRQLGKRFGVINDAKRKVKGEFFGREEAGVTISRLSGDCGPYRTLPVNCVGDFSLGIPGVTSPLVLFFRAYRDEDFKKTPQQLEEEKQLRKEGKKVPTELGMCDWLRHPIGKIEPMDSSLGDIPGNLLACGSTCKLNLKWCEENNKYPYGLKRTIVHEIGHLLGFKHEFAHPKYGAFLEKNKYTSLEFIADNDCNKGGQSALPGYKSGEYYDFGSTMNYQLIEEFVTEGARRVLGEYFERLHGETCLPSEVDLLTLAAIYDPSAKQKNDIPREGTRKFYSWMDTHKANKRRPADEMVVTLDKIKAATASSK